MSGVWDDQGRPIDLSVVPAVREVDRFLAAGDGASAVRAAFPLVMMDVQRAYGLKFPPHWTSRDALAHGLRLDMGRLPDLLIQLHALYEPVRFGTPQDWVLGDVRALVRQIYTETSLRAVALNRETPEARVTVIPNRRAQDAPFLPRGGSP